MKKKIGLCCAAALCLMLIVSAMPVQSVPSLVRLHVLAASDSPEDQAQKLVVRDAVLETTRQMLAECTDYQQAYAILDERLSEVEASAQNACAGESVAASLTREHYPDRDYGAFTLPEGEYMSLRVMIGEGEGKNWWCVVYPSLCMPQSEQAQQIPEIISERPLRSVVWDWLRSLWQERNEAQEGFEHV